MPLADLQDINVHLPEEKIEVDSARYDTLQLDGERIVRGYLAGYIDSAILASWTTPETTPGIIRAAIGRLVAAFYYRQRYSEDSTADPQFAKEKYDEAMAILLGVQNGTILIDDVVVSGPEHFAEADGYPNDDAPGPFFTMTMFDR